MVILDRNYWQIEGAVACGNHARLGQMVINGSPTGSGCRGATGYLIGALEMMSGRCALSRICNGGLLSTGAAAGRVGALKSAK